MPESLRIILDGDKEHAFRPGDEIRGRAEWSVAEPPDEAAVHLCWFTRGIGTEDMAVVSAQVFDNAKANDQRPFAFRAPDQPYSFSGTLISLVWAVELVIDPGEQCERLELTIGPEAKEIELPGTVEDEKARELPASKVL